MVEAAGDHVTVWTDYGTGRVVRYSSAEQSQPAAGDEEAELLLVKLNERRVTVGGRAVVTVIILTTINLLNYTDRYTIAGRSVRQSWCF